MFDVLRSRLVWIILLGFAFAQTSTAATVAQEREKLDNLQQTLAIQQKNLADVLQEKNDYPDKLSEVQGELSKAQAELDKEQKDLQQLKTANADPSVDNSREIMLKEHAVRMAERGVSREQRTLERLERNLGNIDEDAAKIQANISRLENQIIEQKVIIADTESIEQRSRQAAAVPKPKTPPPPPVQPKPEQTVAKASPPPAPVATPEPAPEPALPPLNEDEMNAFEIAKKMEAELDEIRAKGETGSKRAITLEGSDLPDVELAYVGSDHYVGEAPVVSGSQRIKVDNSRFRISIPDGDDGETYIFVTDKSSRQTRVTYYKKALLAYIGKNPQVASATSKPAAQQASAPVKNTSKTSVTLESGNTIEIPEDDLYAFEIAQEQMIILDELKQIDGDDKPFFNDLALTGNQIDGTVKFEYLYQDQYVAETKVQAGRQVLRINRSRYRIDIPEHDDGEIYVFYIDADRPERLQLTFFKKSLLAYF